MNLKIQIFQVLFTGNFNPLQNEITGTVRKIYPTGMPVQDYWKMKIHRRSLNAVHGI